MSESSRISYNTVTYSTPSQLTYFGAFSNDHLFVEVIKNFFYPLFTEISRFGHLPHIFDLIQFLLMIIQEIGVTMWCGSISIYNTKNSLFDIFYWFTDWGIVRNETIEQCVIQYVIGFSLFLLTNLFLIFLAILYKQKRNFDKWHLIIARFLFFPLLTYLLPIYGSFIGRSFYELLSRDPNSISVTFFVFSIPIYLISVHEFYFIDKFLANTPVIDQSLIGTWNDQFLFITVFSISIGSCTQLILEIFPKWLRVAALIGYIFLLFYRIYLLYFAPMLRYLMNSLFESVCIMSIFNCLLSIVHIFISKIPSWIYLFSSIVIFFISLIFTVIWFKTKRVKYLRQISYPKNLSELEKRTIFDSIVFSSARDAISFIHIGVMYQAETIIDLSFLRYLMENYAEPMIMISVSKAASFFPSETRFLSYCLAEVEKKVKKKKISDDFLIYQMKHIQVIRQSSVSAEASSQLNVLQKMSRDTISQVRSFWSEIMNAKNDISFASLQYLRKLTMKTDSAFLDSCDSFPNNVAILNEYCKFQIEGMGNFSGAISSSKKMFLLDQGKNLTIDHAFKALVNVYPDYLLKNIFNIHGNLIRNGLLRDQSSISISSTISTQEEIEEKYDEFISQLYTHGKLRIALQMRMKNTKLMPLTMALVLSVVQLFFCVFLYILFVFIFPISSNNALDAIECCNEFSKISLHLQYISCIVGVRSAIKKRAFSGVNMLRSQLGVSSNDIRKDPSFFQNPEKAIFNSTRRLRAQFDLSTREIISTMKNVVTDISNLYDETTEYHRENNLTQVLSIQSSIAHYCYTAEVLSTIISTSSDNIDKLSEELLINTDTITTSLELLQVQINEKGIESIEKKNNLIQNIGFIIVFFGCLLLLMLRIYNHVLIFDVVKKCSNLLRRVDSNFIKESFQPIALKNQSEIIGDINPHSAHEYDFLLILHPIVAATSIIAIVVFATFSIFYFYKSLGITDSIFQWFLYGNVRFSSILGSLVILCSGSTNVIDHDTEFALLSERIEYLIISQKYIDLTLMKIDPEINQLYFSKQCQETSISSYKEYAQCLSLSSKIYVATSAIQNLVNNDAPTVLNNQDFATLIYMIDTFLYEDLESFQELIVQYAFNHFASASNMTNSMCIAGLIFGCIIFLVEQFFFMKFQQSFDAIKQLISMLPPVSVATSNLLMNFMSNGINYEDSEISLSASESIISMTSTAAVMLNKDKIIQAVNKAVNDTTGFMPDQILGQNVKWLIPPPTIDYGVKVREVNKRFYNILDQISVRRNEFHNIAKSKTNETQDSLSLIDDFENKDNDNDDDELDDIDDETEFAFTSTMAVTTAPTNCNPNSSSNFNLQQRERSFMDSNDSNQNNPISFTNTSMRLKKNGYAKLAENEEHYFSENVIVLTTMCLTESGSIIPMQTTILYLRDRASADDQYVILLRDTSKEAKLLKAAQETRSKTAKLLNSLIPSSLVSAILATSQSKVINSAMNSALSNSTDTKSSKENENVELMKKKDGSDICEARKIEVECKSENAGDKENINSNESKLDGLFAKESTISKSENSKDSKSNSEEKNDQKEVNDSKLENSADSKVIAEDKNSQKESANSKPEIIADSKITKNSREEINNLEQENKTDNKITTEDKNNEKESTKSESENTADIKSTTEEKNDAKEATNSMSEKETADFGNQKCEKDSKHEKIEPKSSEVKEQVEIQINKNEEDEDLSHPDNLTNSKPRSNSLNDSEDSEEYKSIKIESDNESENEIETNQPQISIEDSDSSSYYSTENRHKTANPDNESTAIQNQEEKCTKPSKEEEEEIHLDASKPLPQITTTTETLNENNDDDDVIKRKTESSITNASTNINENENDEKTARELNNSINSLDSKEKSKASTSFAREIEKNSFFSSDSATVIIMKIVGLNDYVHIISPEQLTHYLKTIYDEFEKVSREFPEISILKMNVEQFVACCGLFSCFGDLNEQANQAVFYACSMNKKIEAINEELNIDLRLKIGINNGGPLLGSMLSPTKPSFEILGDFIAIAQKIQNEGEIGLVNVSENVAMCLDKKLFAVEKAKMLIGDSIGSEISVFTVTVVDNNNNNDN